MTVSVGEAPGKVILIGEHAVVYGHPAIAIPLRGVSARAEVAFRRDAGVEFDAADLEERVLPGGEASPRVRPLVRLAEAVAAFFGEKETGFRIVLRSSVPIGRGLGSGAAAAVAIVRGMCKALGRSLHPEQMCELADVAEREFHGTPSGVDCAVIARDEPIFFVKGKEPRGIPLGGTAFHFLVADSGISSATADVVAAVRERREKDRATVDSYFWEIGSLASVSREILRSGSPAELGLCMNRAHRALQPIGVSCPEMDQLVSTALEHGALGAKLSGAGRGGVALILMNDADDESRLTPELINAGAQRVFSAVLSQN